MSESVFVLDTNLFGDTFVGIISEEYTFAWEIYGSFYDLEILPSNLWSLVVLRMRKVEYGSDFLDIEDRFGVERERKMSKDIFAHKAVQIGFFLGLKTVSECYTILGERGSNIFDLRIYHVGVISCSDDANNHFIPCFFALFLHNSVFVFIIFAVSRFVFVLRGEEQSKKSTKPRKWIQSEFSFFVFFRFLDGLLPSIRNRREEYLDGCRLSLAEFPERADDGIYRITFEFLIGFNRIVKRLRENELDSFDHFFVLEYIHLFRFVDYGIRIEGTDLFFNEIFCFFWNDYIEVDFLFIRDIFEREIVLTENLRSNTPRMEGLERRQELFHETDLLLEISRRFLAFILLTVFFWYENPQEYHIDGPTKIYTPFRIKKCHKQDGKNTEENNYEFC